MSTYSEMTTEDLATLAMQRIGLSGPIPVTIDEVFKVLSLPEGSHWDLAQLDPDSWFASIGGEEGHVSAYGSSPYRCCLEAWLEDWDEHHIDDYEKALKEAYERDVESIKAASYEASDRRREQYLSDLSAYRLKEASNE